ncbi:MAG: hypothetical protein FJ117_03625 [Deltaproteobacteria bacterium]|nr:hypothetical protein [Deltaproteobacteria bacterium]
MKNCFASTVVLISFVFLMGMGELGGTAPVDKIPEPKKNFTVVVIDRQGVKTSLSQFSHDGHVIITGKRGSANVTIPFENISQVQFQGLEGNEILAVISMREPKNFEIKIGQKSKFYGKAEFGTFQIEARDLKSINFHP